jgi:hypothetical protein
MKAFAMDEIFRSNYIKLFDIPVLVATVFAELIPKHF